jgi:hypothetical protein
MLEQEGFVEDLCDRLQTVREMAVPDHEGGASDHLDIELVSS